MKQFALLLLLWKTVAAAAAQHEEAALRSPLAGEYVHFGGGLTSTVMSSIISKLPPVTPPKDGVRDDTMMRTVRLTGDYQGDETIILPSFTRLVLDGSITALPYSLSWIEGSAGDPNETAALVSVKNGVMVSIEGGTWTCAEWNSTAVCGLLFAGVILLLSFWRLKWPEVNSYSLAFVRRQRGIHRR